MSVAVETEIGLNIKNLSYAFNKSEGRKKIFSNFDLQITKGSFVAFMGLSGCGKSTLLRLIAGLIAPSNDCAIFIPETQSVDSFRIAFMFQDSRLLPWRNIVKNVELGLESLPITPKIRKIRALQALSDIGIEELADRYPSQLSGGQQQRVALARALATEPSLLLMDEPFSALDWATRTELQNELLDLWSRTNKTILFVTHDQTEAHRLAQRVITLGNSPCQILSDETGKAI